MTISNNIIIGESIAHNAAQILEDIRANKKSKKIVWYGVTTSFEKENLMYILNGVEFGQSFYHNGRRPLRLLGLAGSRKEACEIVLKLVQIGYNNHYINDMKQYLEVF